MGRGADSLDKTMIYIESAKADLQQAAEKISRARSAAICDFVTRYTSGMFVLLDLIL